ncbi:IclR family transcriptional regulator [Ectobacillus panaciterrae]|uniref:IclR family transcriptional regulator n=1 Tax=Ectobacillus panaciterrae TaxID=363872 RepID=UPI0003F949FC|nr:IclR family transcriptional regulator [Ectobacillus panaciterrae]
MSRNKTIVKSMDVLHLFYNHEYLTLHEMTELSGIPKTSVHRLAGSLEEMGFLERTEEGKYTLGLLFLRFGQLVSERLDLPKIARAHMKKLRDELGEAVNLIVRDGNEAVYIDKLEGVQSVRVYTAMGRRAPLYAGACPRILLAYLPKEQQTQFLDEADMVPYAKGTITERSTLETMLEETREKGYAISYSELENHSAAIACPIFASDGTVVAGLSISGVEAHYTEENMPRFIQSVRQAAYAISRDLGWRGKERC